MTRSILHFFYQLIDGDHEWAERRLILLAAVVMGFVLMGRATEQIAEWGPLQSLMEAMPGPVVFGFSFIHPQTVRHVLPPLGGLVLALLLASNYVRDLFELPDLGTGFRYLMASMFAWAYPSINIKGGGYDAAEKSQPGIGQSERARAHPIPIIGGPGFVHIAAGNVALFERAGRPSKIAGAGRHFIQRFETLREVVDLRDQFRTQEEIRALTKDGIPVTVRNVQVSFRVRTGSRRGERTPEETYPFSPPAIRRITYGRNVAASGPSSWTDAALSAVAGAVRGLVSRSYLDDLIGAGEIQSDASPADSATAASSTAPQDKPTDPREKIKSELRSDPQYVRFAEMGIELLWVSLGHIETPQDILDERIRAWQAAWRRQERVALARTEANTLRLMEWARGYARKAFIEKIAQSLPMDKLLNPDVVIIQFVEVLSNMLRSESESSPAAVPAEAAKQLTKLQALTLKEISKLLSGGGQAGGAIIEG